MGIPFTQYKRPDGHKVDVSVERPAEIETKANRLIGAGYSFSIEKLSSGEVSMDCSKDDEPIAIEVVPDGPKVLEAVNRLVDEAFSCAFGTPSPL